MYLIRRGLFDGYVVINTRSSKHNTTAEIVAEFSSSSIENEITATYHRYHIKHLSVCHLSACYPTNHQTELKNNNQDDAHTAKCSMPSMLVSLYSR